MAAIAKKHTSQLERLKKCVEDSYQADYENYETYKRFNRLTFDSTLDEAEKAALTDLDRPLIECNTMEASVSRLLGEFERHEPSIVVMATDGTKVNPQVIDIVEDHLRHAISEANKDGFQYESFRNSISGGFSTSKIWTEYANERSNHQVIKFGCSYDPTLDGFDPLAKKPHKGDGKYAFTCTPKIQEEVAEEYGIELDNLKYTRALNGFSWSYVSSAKQKIVMVCEFYEKKKKKVKIVELTTGESMIEEEALKFIEEWNMSGKIEQAPRIKKSRNGFITTIDKFIFIENKILSHEKTDFTQLPLVFGDGNSRYIRKFADDSYLRKTRPYVYNLLGIQKLENLALQSLATEIDNIPQQKTMISVEALPDQPDYLLALSRPQKASTLIWKEYKNNDPNVRNAPPQTVQRQAIPPEISQTLVLVNQKMQMILGSFDAEQGINDNDTSGKAIALGAIQSSAAAKPYLINYLSMLEQIANIYVNLLPKYYLTPRTIPVLSADGKRDFVMINQEGGPSFDYDENALQVKIEAGPSSSIAKTVALQQIIALTKNIPLFGEFINRKGLEVVLDNIEIRGIDKLKELAHEFMQELQQQQQMQQQMAQQEMMNNPMVMRAQNERMKIQQDGMIAQQDAQLKSAEIAISQEEVDNDRLDILAKMSQSAAEVEAKKISAEAEEMRAKVDMAIKVADMHHSHVRDVKELDIASRERRTESR